MTLKEKVIDELEFKSDSEIVRIYNEFAEDREYNMVREMDELDEFYNGMSHREFLCMLADDFSVNDDYWLEDDNANINSGEGAELVWSEVSESELADWIIENEYFYKFDIDTDGLEEEEEQEEEE